MTPGPLYVTMDPWLVEGYSLDETRRSFAERNPYPDGIESSGAGDETTQDDTGSMCSWLSWGCMERESLICVMINFLLVSLSITTPRPLCLRFFVCLLLINKTKTNRRLVLECRCDERLNTNAWIDKVRGKDKTYVWVSVWWVMGECDLDTTVWWVSTTSVWLVSVSSGLHRCVICCCLLWIVKARAKDKTYKRMSVWWKTTN